MLIGDYRGRYIDNDKCSTPVRDSIPKPVTLRSFQGEAEPGIRFSPSLLTSTSLMVENSIRAIRKGKQMVAIKTAKTGLGLKLKKGVSEKVMRPCV